MLMVWDGLRRARAELLAALLALAGFTITAVARGWPPFGSHSRNTYDLGDQYVPMHGYLRDLLTGNADGDILFNAQSAFGVPFLPDFASYFGNPLSLLVLLFPRDRLDAALLLITALKLAIAAAAMVVFLRRLAPGPWPLLGLAGAAYGLCAFAVDDAVYITMWLDGLIFFPLLCLVGEWCLKRRPHWVASVAIFALAWFSNFYTAYMATIGAGLVLIARIVMTRGSFTAVVRFGLRAAAGVGLILPTLVPTYFAIGQGAAGYPPGPLEALAVREYAATILPAATWGGVSPAVYAGSAVILACLMLPLHDRLASRARVAWGVLAVALAASMVWSPARIAWHGFDFPDGNPNRQAFVMAGVLVMIAWVVISAGPPSRPAIISGLVALGLVCLQASRSAQVTKWTGVLMAITLTVAVAGLVLWRQRPQAKRLLAGSAALMVVVLAGELTASSILANTKRETLHPSRAAWTAEHDERLAAVASARDYPAHRTDPGVPALVRNDPLLFAAEGAGYYSSLIPDITYRTLAGLGYPTDVRVTLPSENPVLDVLFGIGARVRTDGSGAVTLTRQPGLPLVSFRETRWRAPVVDSAFDRQEALLGKKVYEYAPFTIAGGQATIRCTRTGSVWLSLPGGAGVTEVGPAGAGVSLSFEVPPGLSEHSIACLDDAALAAAVIEMTNRAPVTVSTGGHTLTAEIVAPSDGLAVLSFPAVAGWSCSAPTVEFGGLLAVPVQSGASELQCRFIPPGLRYGLTGGAITVLLIAGYAVFSRRRRTAVVGDI